MQRMGLIAAGVLAVLLALLAIMILIYQQVRIAAAAPPPPIAYSRDHYAPERFVYAPGDTLIVSATLTYNTWGPANVRRTFVNRATGLPARLCDGSEPEVFEGKRNLLFENIGVARVNRAAVPIPALPPGIYWLTYSIEGSGGRAQFEVPFRVTKACGG